MQLDPVAKILLVLGGLLILAGVGWQFGIFQALKLGQLPGDIRIEKENFSFYFPVTTCILLSGVLMLLSWLFGKPGS
jgi:hypothetical protein